MKNRIRRLSNYRDGFTLVEIIVVLVIIAILAAIAIFSYSGYIDKANKTADDVNLRMLNVATATYAALNQKPTTEVFPEDMSDADKMELLFDEKLLDEIPVPKQKDVTFVFSYEAGKWYLSNESINVLYQSDFDDDFGIISLINGWSLVDGKLVHQANGESRAIFSGSSGSDYMIELTGTYLSGSSSQSGYGIYYRATDNANITGYCFQFDPGAGNRFTVRKVVDGSEKNAFQSVSMASVMGSGFDISAPHDIKIVVSGSQHVITVDGVEVLNFTDSTYTEGYVGVRTWNNSRVEIDNVSVTEN